MREKRKTRFAERVLAMSLAVMMSFTSIMGSGTSVYATENDTSLDTNLSDSDFESLNDSGERADGVDGLDLNNGKIFETDYIKEDLPKDDDNYLDIVDSLDANFLVNGYFDDNKGFVVADHYHGKVNGITASLYHLLVYNAQGKVESSVLGYCCQHSQSGDMNKGDKKDDGEVYRKGDVIGNFTTDKNGFYELNGKYLQMGTYKVVEKTAPNGMIRDSIFDTTEVYFPNSDGLKDKSTSWTTLGDGYINDLTSERSLVNSMASGNIKATLFFEDNLS